MTDLTPTEDELLTHEGRKICEAKELGGGYCGSCDIETHVIQVRDPESWIHTSLHKWREMGIRSYRKKNGLCPECGHKID